MSLTSSLFTGTSGLTNMGNAMQVIGDNISNVNTVGYKGNRYTFADLLNQSVATQSGSAQVGRGMALGSVDGRFSQGSFESTGNTTDLSIGGNGFFVVRQAATDKEFYTRAGNFNFDKDGKLINPEGYIVQGWKLDEDTGDDLGSVTDVILQSFTSPPKQSSKVTVVTNLDADAESKSVVLANAWDSGDTPPMPPNNYEYQTVVKVYDSLGSTHDITIYYDKKDGADWEYIITMNPEEDKRALVQGTDSKGLLARGTIEFNDSDGTVNNVTMQEFSGRVGNVRSQGVNSHDDIHFVVNSTENMTADGFDFSFEFNGNNWNFEDKSGPAGIPDGVITAADKPAKYPNAQITYSDGKRIEIALNPDPANPLPDPDLVIRLDTAAVATDALKFDINNPSSMHTQTLSGLTYIGDTGNENTTLQINDPNVMVRDQSDISVVWDAQNEEWYWSNPSERNVIGQNYAGMTATTSTLTVANSSAMNQYVDDIRVRWNGTSWDWNMPTERNATFVAGTGQVSTGNATMTVNNPLLLTNATAGNVVLNYNGSGAGGWSFAAGAPAEYPAAVVLPGSDENSAQVDLNGDGTADMTFTFNSALSTAGVNSTVSFKVDPAPPLQYPNATITTIDNQNFSIDFDGTGGVDATFAFDAAAAAAGEVFVFDTDPRVRPAEYQNAVLKGDKDKVIIDLDGSGGDNDTEDVVFTFGESMRSGANIQNSTITFDIEGGTSWRGMETSEMSTAGYFQFKADFLGSSGEIGEDGKFQTTEQMLEFDIGSVFNGVNFTNGSLSTTQFARASSTTFQSADGYGAGDLEGVEVSADGIMTGTYSNGQLIPLYRVALAKFQNNQGLYKEGGNLYRETRESGTAITGKPGTNGLGSLSPNSLEMSNVDIADEFVKMITTQRGFQANSKIVTTVDTMLDQVIQMKR